MARDRKPQFLSPYRREQTCDRVHPQQDYAVKDTYLKLRLHPTKGWRRDGYMTVHRRVPSLAHWPEHI